MLITYMISISFFNNDVRLVGSDGSIRVDLHIPEDCNFFIFCNCIWYEHIIRLVGCVYFEKCKIFQCMYAAAFLCLLMYYVLASSRHTAIIIIIIIIDIFITIYISSAMDDCLCFPNRFQ